MSEIDITQLHGKPGLRYQPATRRAVNESIEPADFKTGRAQPVATNGEGQWNRRPMGTTPQKAKVFYPIKNKTHFIRRKVRKPRDRQNSCADKVPYANSAAAHEAIRGMIKNKKRFTSMHAYQCRECPNWHITRR